MCCDSLPCQHVYSRMTWSPTPNSSSTLSHPLLLTLSPDNPDKPFEAPSPPLSFLLTGFFPQSHSEANLSNQATERKLSLRAQHHILLDLERQTRASTEVIPLHGIFASRLNLTAILSLAQPFPNTRTYHSVINSTSWHLSTAIHTTHKPTTTNLDSHSARDQATAPSAQP